MHGYGTLGHVTSQCVHEQIEMTSTGAATCENDASRLRHHQQHEQQQQHYSTTLESVQAKQMGSTGRAGTKRCDNTIPPPTTDAASREDDARVATLSLSKHQRCLAGRMGASPRDDATLCNLANETLVMLRDKPASS